MTWTTETVHLGDLELRLVPDIGGRMLDVIFKGESLLFQNPDLLGHQRDLGRLEQLPSRAQHIPFPLWGGEKTWIAPQTDWPDGAPYKALDSGRYAFTRDNPHSVTMISPICSQSGLQIERVISLKSADRLLIRHTVTNHYGEFEWHSPVAHLQPAQCHSFDLDYQVILEKPDRTPSEVYQMIESHDEVCR